MSAAIQRLVEAAGGMGPGWAYLALLLSAVLENVFPPVPGDTVVVFAAYLVGRGVLSFWPVYGATWLGGTAGFLLMYYLGLTRGRALLAGLGGRYLGSRSLARAEGWLARHGAWLILANRFLSGVRSAIAIAAGIGAVPWRTVAVCGAASMAIWNGLLIGAGLLVGRNWELVAVVLRQYNRVVAALLLLAVAGVLWRRRRRRRTGSTLTAP